MKSWLLLTVILSSITAFGQEVWMHPNAGQWDDRIEYKVELHTGEMLIEKDGFTFHLNNAHELYGHSHDSDDHHENELLETHVIKSKFIGSDWQGQATENKKSGFYRNYLLGNDQSKWKSKLYSFAQITLIDYYEGIDMVMDGSDGGFKYSFVVHPGVSPQLIRNELIGQSDVQIDEDGNLHIANRFGEIIETAPIAWTVGENGKKHVEVRFSLQGNQISYVFPEGYDQTKDLVIDPSLTFSTFSGSTADNWGFTAAPDVDGNLFGGGVVFGLGYPTTPGAYDSSPNGGLIDVAITKFTDDGTALIYSTYLGGSESETPNSIVAADNGELFIFGITSSSNFPMAGNPYDNSYNGGPSIPNNQTNSLGFTAGSDLYVARLSSDGSALLASTYIGGSNNDGLNNSNLQFNYGDQFRGEIILDANNDVYVASMTQSSDFPTVMGTQNSLNGTQDAVMFKMPQTLNTLTWSTYFGGSGIETGNALEVSSAGEVYLVGGTSSSSLPFNSGADLTFDGDRDGYIARFTASSGMIISGSYIGLNEYDQTYFVQLDLDNKVYVLGQTQSNLGITAGQYGNANSGQFIWQFNSNLSTVLWKTMVGASTGNVEISPTAFLVSDCYDIYLSGWGGVLNANPGVSQAVNSSSNGFPVTSGPNNAAYQSTTNGSNFWIAVLGQDATLLKYATFMGGTTSSYNHVDGGTSRFDKSGRIYHAVCGACGGNPNGFTSTPGVWSETNLSSNCNMAAFKFELSQIEALVTDPNPVVCLPNSVDFVNTSSNGNAYFWDFGDGTTSTQENPSHLYPGPGTYYATLVVSDTNGCFTPDSIDIIVEIGDFLGGVVTPPGPICPGDSYQLEAYGGATYAWTPAQYLDDSTLSMPTATVDSTTTFTVIISDTCGIDTAYVTLETYLGTSTITDDTVVCIGSSIDLLATGGVSYQWSPANYLSNPNVANPTCTPTNDITYMVTITTANGCVLEESVFVDVYFDPPQPIIPDTLSMCEGSSVTITVSGADMYFWSPNSNISAVDTNVVEVSPVDDMYYYCNFSNVCGSVLDSVFIDVTSALIEAMYDTIICPGETATLMVTGGVSYQWNPSAYLDSPISSLVHATPAQPTMFYVTGTDMNGCVSIDSVFVDLYPQPWIQASPDAYVFVGDLVPLSATTSTPGPIVWDPAEYLTCVVCSNPTANPDQNYTYIASYTDINGCSASDTVNIFYDPIIYVPNTFTPGGDNSVNTYFKVEGGNVSSFELLIFDRWGELICTLNDIDEYWDGTYEGNNCQDGTYVWKLSVRGINGKEYKYVGHVNLLR